MNVSLSTHSPPSVSTVSAGPSVVNVSKSKRSQQISARTKYVVALGIFSEGGREKSIVSQKWPVLLHTYFTFQLETSKYRCKLKYIFIYYLCQPCLLCKKLNSSLSKLWENRGFASKCRYSSHLKKSNSLV